MQFPRSSGILLHVTSLPSEYGIGDLGEGAYRFIDFLQEAGQTIWQILPLGPPAMANSPYSAFSAFAGNPLLISPADLVQRGLLEPQEIEGLRTPGDSATSVDFESVVAKRVPLLQASFERFKTSKGDTLRDGFSAFCAINQSWLDDFARYQAIIKHYDIQDWSRWPDRGLVAREQEALQEWDLRLGDEIEFEKYVQFMFTLQWKKLKAYANERTVRIFGDMPIFVAYESADVWANQELFCLDDDGNRTVVAGVPPDYFSETGQLWGNPLYRWDAMKADGYEWWINRFQSAFSYYDLLRIDHFRAFESYWEVPADAETAVNGTWQPGPLAAPFKAAEAALGKLPIIAEDLGLITDAVHALREQLGFPGMRVFQFGFDDIKDDFHRPSAFPKNSAAYTGTHDNDTLLGWYNERKETRESDPLLEAVVASDHAEPHKAIIASVLESVADTAILPMQDVLAMGAESRMNVPGEAFGNWEWRCPTDALSSETAAWLRAISESTGRAAKTPAFA